jgi:Domain of unknown function (DUF4145)
VSDSKPAAAASLIQNPSIQFSCPHCGAYAQHDRLVPSQPHNQHISYSLGTRLEGRQGIAIAAVSIITRCVLCKKDTYFLVKKDPGRLEILHQFPLPSTIAISHLPENMSAVVVEAEKCLAVGAPNACGVMCRRAMHVLCQEKGASGKDLYDQLQDLKDRHLITPDLWDWAEELRVVGKHGAHPEWEDVTMEDADYAMRFLREVLRYVYINPAERAARKLKESSTKKTSATP